MIDKFDSNDKLLELTYLNNFGIELNIHKQLKSIISSSSSENEQHFKDILKRILEKFGLYQVILPIKMEKNIP